MMMTWLKNEDELNQTLNPPDHEIMTILSIEQRQATLKWRWPDACWNIMFDSFPTNLIKQI